MVTVTNLNTNELSAIQITGRTSTSINTLPYTSYIITVAARTSVGVGPPSVEVVIETPEDGMIVIIPLTSGADSGWGLEYHQASVIKD